MELHEKIEQEYQKLLGQKKELQEKVAEIDGQLAPILAFMSAGKKKVPVARKRRVRKSKAVETLELL